MAFALERIRAVGQLQLRFFADWELLRAGPPVFRAGRLRGRRRYPHAPLLDLVFGVAFSVPDRLGFGSSVPTVGFRRGAAICPEAEQGSHDGSYNNDQSCRYA